MLQILQPDRVPLKLEDNDNSLVNQISSKFKLPQIERHVNHHKRRSYTDQNNQINQDSPIKRAIINSRWKLNRPYLDGYAQLARKQQKRNKRDVDKIETGMKSDEKQQAKDIFFTNVGSLKRQRSPNHSDIASTIKKSKDIINLIKLNRKKLIKLKFRDSINTSHSFLNQKNREPDKIYTYLKRGYVVNKEHVIDDDVINRYIGSSPPNRIQGIEQSGRKFLLQKMHSDYNKYELVGDYKKQKIKELIERDLVNGKMRFSSDYKNRYSVPYFSFLSLDNEQKRNILQRKRLPSPKKIYK